MYGKGPLYSGVILVTLACIIIFKGNGVPQDSITYFEGSTQVEESANPTPYDVSEASVLDLTKFFVNPSPPLLPPPKPHKWGNSFAREALTSLLNWKPPEDDRNRTFVPENTTSISPSCHGSEPDPFTTPFSPKLMLSSGSSHSSASKLCRRWTDDGRSLAQS